MFDAVLHRLKPFSQEFTRHGKAVYLVGGAVRNLLLGRAVKDYDFTTDALPQEVQGYFRKVLPTGLQHGTVTVLFQGESYEVTTFRTDGDYSDGRRPDSVEFTASLEEDLKRRDFTINALALNLSDGTLVDFHQGQRDLAGRVLRAIGDPGKRFDEDALRLLRLFRFASQLGFAIDPETLAAVPSRRLRLGAVSRERIRVELAKALEGPFPGLAWVPLQEMGFLADLFAPLSPRPLSLREVQVLGALDPLLRWSYWLTLACGPDRAAWETALKALTFSNADQGAALGPPQAWDWLGQELTPVVKAKAIVDAWGDRGRIGPGTAYLKALVDAGYWVDRENVVGELERLGTTKEPVFLKELALGGKELLALGVAPGPRIGQVLKALQRAVWSEPEINTVETLKERIPSLR